MHPSDEQEFKRIEADRDTLMETALKQQQEIESLREAVKYLADGIDAITAEFDLLRKKIDEL